MDLKVWLKCNCWLYDESEGREGWPDGLNDSPIKPYYDY
jgi:hypothetical protein